MGDTIYNVQVLYRLQTGGAEQKVEGLSSSFKSLSSMADWSVKKIDGLVGSVMSMGKWALLAAGGLGVHALVQSISSLNAEAEGATIGIAGMLQAGGAFTNFQDAMGRSQELMTQMRRDAAALPGTFDDLRQVFQGGLLPGLGAGKSSTEVEHLAARFMSVSKMLQVDSHTAGRELSMLLEGRAGAHVVMWARLQSLIGKSSKDFNAMTSAQRFEAISKAMNGFDPAIKDYEKSWDAVASTTRDTLTNFQRIATTPLFNAVKEDLYQINTWLGNNQALVVEWEMIVGNNLVHAYDRVKDSLHWIWVHHGEILSTAKHAAEGGLVARVGLGLLGNAGGAGLARSGLTALGGLAGGGLGMGALLATAVIAPLAIAAARGKIDLESTFKKVLTATEPLIASFGKLGEVLLPTIDDLGRFSAGLIEAVADGLTPFTLGLKQFVDLQVDSIHFWSNQLHDLGKELGDWLKDHGLIRTSTADRSEDIPWSDVYSGNSRETTMSLLDHIMSMRNPTLTRYGIVDADRQLSATGGGTEEMDPNSHFRFNAQQQRAIQEEVNRHAGTHAQNHYTVNVYNTINEASDPERVYISVNRAIWDAMYRPMAAARSAVLR